MSLSYWKLSRHPRVFLHLTGVSVDDFCAIVWLLRPDWEKLESKKKQVGRHSNLETLEDKVLCVLMYYRTYITHEFLGYLFDLHNSNICRLFRKIESLLAKRVSIKKDRTLTADKVMELLADVTEQQTQRPSRGQKKKYSGKKKKHTIKTEIVIDKGGRIHNVSRSHGGRTHDFKIRKQEKPLPRDSTKYADSGYQGWQKIQSNVVIPFKKPRKSELLPEQKEHNQKLASLRVKVEHKIKQLKVFNILSNCYRNFQKKYNMRFNIIAGIVNMKYAT
jgi:hypothetical protein